MAVEASELRLVWPPELFAAEARMLLTASPHDDEALGSLMAEAFHGGRGYKLLLERTSTWRPVPFSIEDMTPPWQGSRRVALVESLAARAGDLPRYEAPRYYRSRRAPLSELRRLALTEVKAAYADAVIELESLGYFDDAFGSTCVDADGDPGAQGQRKLSQLLMLDLPMWPLQRDGAPTGVEQGWSEEDLCDVVEALHDLIARPRRRSWHDYGEEWDYSDSSRASGQAVYRWKVNEILERSELPVRLAAEGEDAGRLVHVTGDDRDRLMQRALTAPDPVDRDAVGHAVALFRARGAGREERRSAVLALARVLEDRRPLLIDELYSKDEGALFTIANEFDVRHRGVRGGGKRQHADYDDAFLEWFFWWYLATIELTDRILARQSTAS